jgi:hypothetical protein
MVAMSKSAGQDRGGVTIDGEWVGVPDDVDGAARGSFERTDRLALAVRSGELNYGNAGRASRHKG